MATIKEIKEEQDSDFRFRSSPSDLRQFKEGHVWYDMLKYIRMMNQADQRRLVNASELNDIRKLQGKMEVGLEMEQLPDLLIKIIEERKEIENGRE